MGAITRASACQSSTHVPSAIVPLKFIIAKPNNDPAAANKATPNANITKPKPNTEVIVPANIKAPATIVNAIANSPAITNKAIAFMFSTPQVKVFCVASFIKSLKSKTKSRSAITHCV